LSLRSNQISNIGAEPIARALEHNLGLECLDLRSNNICNFGALRLFEALKLNICLGELQLDNNPIDDIGTSRFPETMLANKTLAKVTLVSCVVGDNGAQHVAEALINNAQMYAINLSYTMIGNAGAASLSNAMKVSKTLGQLFLDGNKIGDSGMSSLSESLKANKSLNELSLSNNKFSHLGLQHLADALEVNGSLSKLNLSRNNIGDAGAIHLGRALLANQGLLELDLSDSNIGKLGCSQLIKGLQINYSLIELQLDINKNVPWEKINDLLGRNEIKRRNDFMETLNGNDRIPWNRSRLMLVGRGKAGKTATVRSIIGQHFVESWDSTVGAEVSELERSSHGWKKLNDAESSADHSSRFAAQIILQSKLLSESPGESLLGIRSGMQIMAGKNKKPILKYVFKRPSRILYRGAKNVSSKMGSPGKGSSNGSTNSVTSNPMFIQPDRTDESRSERQSDAQSLNQIPIAREFNDKLFLEAKRNKDTLTLSVWDFGGQDVFFSMHHIFLTKTGIYLLVFDIREVLQTDTREEALDNMSFWLRSINLHAPSAPVMLVGTFSDTVQKREQMLFVDKAVEEAVLPFSQLARNETENLSFLPIDNKTSSGIVALRLMIERVTRNDEAVNDSVSMRWILLLDEILSKRNEDRNFLTLTDVKELGARVGVNQAEEIEAALRLYHERGMLIHLTSTEILKNIVTIVPQWLVASLSKVIRDDDVHSLDIQNYRAVGLEEDVERTFNEALASRDFLEYVWPKSQVDFFIELMRQTLLLSLWNCSKEKYYLVPSLLKNIYQGPRITGACIVFDFSNGFLPKGLFQRLLCLCIEYTSMRNSAAAKQMSKPEVYQNFCSMPFDRDHMMYLEEDSTLQLITVIVQDETQAARTLEIVLSMIRKINCDVMGSGLKWKTLLEDVETGNLVNLVSARESRLSPWFDTIAQEKKNTETIMGTDLEVFLNML